MEFSAVPHEQVMCRTETVDVIGVHHSVERQH